MLISQTCEKLTLVLCTSEMFLGCKCGKKVHANSELELKSCTTKKLTMIKILCKVIGCVGFNG